MISRLTLLLPLAWRNLWRNSRRSLLVVLAVAVGTMSIIDFTALMQAWARSTISASLRTLTGEAQIHAPGYLADPGVEYRMPPPHGNLLRALAGSRVKVWAPRIRVPGVARSEHASRPITLVGIEPAHEPGLSFIADPMYRGRTLNGPDDDGVIIGRKLVERLKTGLGKRIVLMSEAADGHLAERGFRIVGVYAETERTEDQYVFVGLHTAQTMLGVGDSISEIALDVRNQKQLEPVVKTLRQAAPELDVQSWHTLLPLVEALSEFIQSFDGIWISIMSVLVIFGVANTLLMSVYERTREFGLLQALGLRPHLVIVQVMLESMLLMTLGTVVGVAGGIATIVVFHNGLSMGFLARGAEWLGAGRVLYPQLVWPDLLQAALVVWVLGVLVSLWPAWRAVRHSPLAALEQA